ncbi:MAG: hypothetical protein K6U14_02805 [Firmicutes bacterium]|nr:hypothetical protein [Alicyclobacillaceae bacterium]MCL6496550.1 hypothetical protein [Bacillota bacterium]
MQQFSLLVDDLKTAEAIVQRLWHELGVRGEVALVPLDRAVKVDVISEVDLPEDLVDQLPGKRA